MLRVTNKIKYQIPEIGKNFNKQVDKFMRTILLFDGSMTNLVANLTGAEPKVQILYENIVSKNQILKDFGINKYFLSQILYFNELFQGSKEEQIVQRSITFNINSKMGFKKLYYARSLQIFGDSSWNISAYKEIMSKQPNKPIGLNLINYKIPLFRQINWIGKADLQIIYKKVSKTAQNQQSQQKQIELKQRQIYCRSYSMLSENKLILCELQEYFLDEMIEIFK